MKIEKNLINRFNILIQQLEIMQQYPEEFIEKMGGTKSFNFKIDEILDEINEIRKIIKQINK